MQNLIKSIAENGVLVPCLARENGERYELISGHRRKAACELLGIATLPVIIKDMSREEAIITMVDSNIQRDHILPSEKAFAYKMKLDAMSRQGKRTDLTCATLLHKLDGKKSRDKMAKKAGESHETVRRYIRLTHLIKPLLDMVDEGKIAFTPDDVKIRPYPTNEGMVFFYTQIQYLRGFIALFKVFQSTKIREK